MERAEQLAANGTPELRRRLLAELDRLVNPSQMGQAFKVIALLPAQIGDSQSVTPTTIPGWPTQPLTA